MTEQELDIFFTDTLREVLIDLKECAAYTENLHTPDYDEINQDYEDSIKCIEKVLNTCKTIDDLAEQDDETIDNIYEYLASFSDNLIISAYEPQKSVDLEKSQKLEELLDLFLDDSDYE